MTVIMQSSTRMHYPHGADFDISRTQFREIEVDRWSREWNRPSLRNIKRELFNGEPAILARIGKSLFLSIMRKTTAVI